MRGINIQNTIITASTRHNIPTDRKGVCFGISTMAALAGLVSDIDNFYSRLKTIENLNFKDDSNKSTSSKLDENTSSSKSQSKLDESKYDASGIPSLNQDIENFLGLVNMFQNPGNFERLFNEKPREYSQQKAFEQINSFKPVNLQSEILLKKPFSGCYSKAEMGKFFQILTSLDVSSPLSLVLYNIDHAISVNIDPIAKSYTIVDPNTGIFSGNDAKEMSQQITKSLFGDKNINDKYFIFSTNLLCAGNDNDKKLINQVDEDVDWKKMHEVTDKKAFYTNGYEDTTWLMHAAGFDNSDTFRSLVDIQGSDIDQENTSNTRATHVAISENNIENLKYLIENNASTEGLIQRAREAGNVEIEEYLMSLPSNINSQADYILDWKEAIKNQNINALQEQLNEAIKEEYLIDLLNQEPGQYLIHAACENNQIELVKFALRNNLNLEDIDENDEFPFDIAIRKGNLEICNLFIDHSEPTAQNDENIKKSHLQLTDDNGQTFLHKAVSANNIEIVKKLLLKGLSIETEDDEGNTPLNLAENIGNSELIELLKNHKEIDKAKNSHAEPELGIENAPFEIPTATNTLSAQPIAQSYAAPSIFSNSFPDIGEDFDLDISNNDNSFAAWLDDLENKPTLDTNKNNSLSGNPSTFNTSQPFLSSLSEAQEPQFKKPRMNTDSPEPN